jgi:hypothetical protein
MTDEFEQRLQQIASSRAKADLENKAKVALIRAFVEQHFMPSLRKVNTMVLSNRASIFVRQPLHIDKDDDETEQKIALQSEDNTIYLLTFEWDKYEAEPFMGTRIYEYNRINFFFVPNCPLIAIGVGRDGPIQEIDLSLPDAQQKINTSILHYCLDNPNECRRRTFLTHEEFQLGKGEIWPSTFISC